MDFEEGLDKAYASENGLHADGDTLYVAGTRNLGHVMEWWRIPFHQVQKSEIYRNMDNYLKENPNINQLVGHSYGSSAILEKQKQDNKYKTIAYNSPIVDNIFKDHNKVKQYNRYANAYDPVALFDFRSNRSFKPSLPSSINVHSYKYAGREKDINDRFSDLGFKSYRSKIFR